MSTRGRQWRRRRRRWISSGVFCCCRCYCCWSNSQWMSSFSLRPTKVVPFLPSLFVLHVASQSFSLGPIQVFFFRWSVFEAIRSPVESTRALGVYPNEVNNSYIGSTSRDNENECMNWMASSIFPSLDHSIHFNGFSFSFSLQNGNRSFGPHPPSILISALSSFLSLWSWAVCVFWSRSGWKWCPSAQENKTDFPWTEQSESIFVNRRKNQKKALLILLSIHSPRRGQVDEVVKRFQCRTFAQRIVLPLFLYLCYFSLYWSSTWLIFFLDAFCCSMVVPVC